MTYNYNKFGTREYDLKSPLGIKVGERLNDFEVTTLEGKTKKISSLFDKPTILETGSITCGMFAGQRKKMDELATKYTDFNFIILYVREAHPGSLIGSHNSVEEKLALANQFNKTEKFKNRRIIIDSLSGKLHHDLGLLPNMIFMFNKDRKVIYRGDWNKANRLEKAIIQYRASRTPLKSNWQMLPIPHLREEYRIFKRAGWNAAFDFIKALPFLIFDHIILGLKKNK